MATPTPHTPGPSETQAPGSCRQEMSAHDPVPRAPPSQAPSPTAAGQGRNLPKRVHTPLLPPERTAAGLFTQITT